MNLSQYELIGALVLGMTAIIVFGKPFIELNTIITELKEAVKTLKELLVSFDTQNKDEHNDLYNRVDNINDRVVKLETEHHIAHRGVANHGN